MNRREKWRRVLDAEIKRWAAKPCAEMLAVLSERQVYTVEADGETFQVEVELLENTTHHVHVMVAVDDGSLPAALRPEVATFLCEKPQ